MAFKKTVITPQGFEAVDAYHRVEGISIEEKTRIRYHVRSYKDKEGGPFFAEQVISGPYDLFGGNPISQAYEHLKSLPEFVDAVDC